MLLLSIFASSLSFLLCGLAKTLPMVIIARGFSGLTGGSISVAQAYVADVTTVEERPKYLGLIGATIGIAFTFGPGIGAGESVLLMTWYIHGIILTRRFAPRRSDRGDRRS